MIDVGEVWYEGNKKVAQEALQREYKHRQEMPAGHFNAHLQELDNQRIQAEAERPASALPDLTNAKLNNREVR